MQPTIKAIQQVTARHFGISVDQLKSPRSSRELVRPRQMAMTIIRNSTDNSLPTIGRSFGGRDHTTVLYAIRKITDLVKTDKDVRQQFEALKLAISNARNHDVDLIDLAKQLAPIVAEEITKEFKARIEWEKSRILESENVVVLANECEPELLLAIEATIASFVHFENARFTRGETVPLNNFIQSFEALRKTYREFNPTPNEKGNPNDA